MGQRGSGRRSAIQHHRPLYMLLSDRFNENSRKWAVGTLGTIVGYSAEALTIRRAALRLSDPEGVSRREGARLAVEALERQHLRDLVEYRSRKPSGETIQ